MLDMAPMASQGVGMGISPQDPPDLTWMTYSAHCSDRGR